MTQDEPEYFVGEEQESLETNVDILILEEDNRSHFRIGRYCCKIYSEVVGANFLPSFKIQVSETKDEGER